MKIYNTMTRQLEDFIPINTNDVSMYVCGATTYDYIHIGNARPAVFFDTVRRHLKYKGYNVKYVQNFTDIDDKIINKANKENVTYDKISEKYINAYLEDMVKLNIDEANTIRPKVTDYMEEIVAIIEKLIVKGFAYESDGDVYFDVKAYSDKYGELSNKNIDDLIDGASGRVEINTSKRTSVDFVLWKSVKPNEPSWESPWGNGRAGWHIECSVMSNELLGDTFDIHGGGEDLIFPHHENELAQSKSANGGEYARYWMHNGYVKSDDGEKYSKSLGNAIHLRDMMEVYSGNAIRFFLLSSHYRSPINFSEELINQSVSSMDRITNLIEKINERLAHNDNIKAIDLTSVTTVLKSHWEFVSSMDNDFNTAKAIGVLFKLVGLLNKISDKEKLDDSDVKALIIGRDFILNDFSDMLGVSFIREEVSNDKDTDLIEKLIENRKEAKSNKDFVLADLIREQLKDISVIITDTRNGTIWNYE